MFLIICVFSLFFTICNLHLYINFTVFIELFNQRFGLFFLFIYIYILLCTFYRVFISYAYYSLCRRNAKQICRFTLTDIIVSVDKHAYIHRMFNRYRHSYNYDIILIQRQLLPMHTQDLRSFYCTHIYDMQTIYLFI